MPQQLLHQQPCRQLRWRQQSNRVLLPLLSQQLLQQPHIQQPPQLISHQLPRHKHLRRQHHRRRHHRLQHQSPLRQSHPLVNQQQCLPTFQQQRRQRYPRSRQQQQRRLCHQLGSRRPCQHLHLPQQSNQQQCVGWVLQRLSVQAISIACVILGWSALTHFARLLLAFGTGMPPSDAPVAHAFTHHHHRPVRALMCSLTACHGMTRRALRATGTRLPQVGLVSSMAIRLGHMDTPQTLHAVPV